MYGKHLNNCKIAVCFSGQSRTYKNCAESINNFFRSRQNNQYIFFGHTWDCNDYKIREHDKVKMSFERDLDIKELEANLKSLLPFQNLIVENHKYRPYPWASLFYSAMRSNFLKQKYEVENNMMFDLVIKCRYDLCFPHGKIFEDYFTTHVLEKSLYSHYGFMRTEFCLPNPDDVIYFGTSLTMDLIDSLYTSLQSGAFLKLVSYNQDNIAYSKVGPGILIHKWASIKNILPIHNNLSYLVLRKAAEELDYKTDWDKMLQIGRMMYI